MPLLSPSQAINAMLARLAPVDGESVALSKCAGRILSEPLVSDRPSPPADVSAMDGYAVRISDLANGPLRVSGEVAIGQPPPSLPPGQAVRIFTGGAVPPEADAVIPRELVKERPDTIEIPANLDIHQGQHIRRRGDNLAGGQAVIQAGTQITASVAAALAAFGCAAPKVYRRIRLSIIVTGNELLPVESSPRDWQLRDSNGPMLAGLFSNAPWIDLTPPRHVGDVPGLIQSALRDALERADAVLLTGGVSMGDHDYVPAAVEAAGGQAVFHKLAIRPGKPLLGAVGPGNRAIFGLPGNPVSSLITARRLATIVLRKLAGFTTPDPAPATVRLRDAAGNAPLPLWWYRPVRQIEPGLAEVVATQGSGDLVSAARSDGFIEISPEQKGVTTHFSFYPWRLT